MDTTRSTKILLWALLMFCCPDPGWTTQTEEMINIMEIMDRMTRMEAEMVAKDHRIAVLEDAMKTKDQRISVLEDAMETSDIQMCELGEEMKSLTGRITVTEETDVLLRERWTKLVTHLLPSSVPGKLVPGLMPTVSSPTTA